MSIEDLIINLREYIKDENEINEIKKAYKIAEKFHERQYRKSGEPYIIHPLNVAYILSEFKLDKDTICAGLLHDVVEDTDFTLEDIEREFNKTVRVLVDGVTKINAEDYLEINNNDKKAAKRDQNLANTRKIITGLLTDVRIVLIKLADRLHNMRTMQYQKREKQIENSNETMNIYVPLANFLGVRAIRNELEELSFKYLQPSEYEKIHELRFKLEEYYKDILLEMKENISDILNYNNIMNEIDIRTKNAYRIYKKLQGGAKLESIKDLFAFKVLMQNLNDCYLALGLVHSKYHPLNNAFKDYICNPKTNMYKSLHTTIIGKNGKLTEVQLKTFGMDKINNMGLTFYSGRVDENGNQIMQKKLNEQFQFMNSLKAINDYSKNNEQFVEQINSELFSQQIYVYTLNGNVVSLPVGSSIIDFAYNLDAKMGNNLIAAYIDDERVPIETPLHNKDRVRLVFDDKKAKGPNEDWLNCTSTASAKMGILTYINKKHL